MDKETNVLFTINLWHLAFKNIQPQFYVGGSFIACVLFTTYELIISSTSLSALSHLTNSLDFDF